MQTGDLGVAGWFANWTQRHERWLAGALRGSGVGFDLRPTIWLAYVRLRDTALEAVEADLASSALRCPARPPTRVVTRIGGYAPRSRCPTGAGFPGPARS